MLKYLSFFIIYLSLILPYIIKQYNDKVKTNEKTLEISVKNNLKAATNSYEHLNESYHNQYEAKMSYLIKDASDAVKKDRDKIRYKLRKELTTLFNDRKLTSLNSFHIFDKYGNSLIRFHRLDRYDDPIINKRESLRNMLETMSSKSGFEVGEYAVTYRFQYPLFYDGEFIGSYEFGMGFNTVNKEMQKLFGINNKLFISGDIINDVSLDETTKKLYEKIDIHSNTFYIFKDRTNSNEEERFEKFIEKLQKPQSVSKDFTTFSRITYNGKNYISVLTPIKDINHKYIGFILTAVEDTFSFNALMTFVEELVIVFLFGLLMIFLIYKELEHKKYIRNIIDTQHDILIVTNGQKIIDANKAFLDFFDVENIKEFVKKGIDCICGYFEDEPGYIQRKMNNINWIEYVKINTDQENIAVIKDKNGINRFFKITIEGFSKSADFIVIFSDITEELKKSKELEKKAYHDTLTKIYSRERFEHFLNQKLN